jgi:hypothetical protein
MPLRLRSCFFFFFCCCPRKQANSHLRMVPRMYLGHLQRRSMHVCGGAYAQNTGALATLSTLHDYSFPCIPQSVRVCHEVDGAMEVLCTCRRTGKGREGKASRRASMIAAARNPPRSVASSVTVFIRLAQAPDSLPIHSRSRRASTSREGVAGSEDERRPPMVAGAPAHE